MPKYRKKQLNKNYRYISTSAESLITFSTAKNSIYFGTGGTSFVLEDAEGTKVRFIYSAIHHNSSPAMGGYFETVNDLQPRYLEGDINAPTTSFEVGKEFFGYGWNQNTDSAIAHYEIGAAVKIFYGDISSLLTSSDSSQVATGVLELISRTIAAINYAEEVKISASADSNNVIRLEQDIEGPSGNKDIFRGFAEGVNNEGNEYAVLTSDIATNSFTGGATETIVYFNPKSGFLSRAVKKVLKDRNNQPSIFPHNTITTGKKINSPFPPFNDLTTQIFLNNEENVDARTKVKLSELDIIDSVATDYLVYSLQDFSNITNTQQAIDLNISNMILSNTEI